VWNSADVLVVNRGKAHDDEEQLHVKSSALHLWLFGYDLTDTVLLLRKDGSVWILAAKKKVEFLKPAASKPPAGGGIKAIHTLLRNKADNAENYQKLWEEAGIAANGENRRVIGMILKETEENQECAVVGPWERKLSEAADAGTIDRVDASAGIGFCMSVKDESELDLMRKSSVLANKVMKHGCVKKMEDVIDSDDGKTTNESLASYVEEVLADPSKISLKVPRDDAGSCYHPIVQSGGKYELKLSAQSTDDPLSPDVILVQFGARYKSYCSNIARTFLVDPPRKMSDMYEALVEVHDACLAAMRPGKQLREVHGAAVRLLRGRGAAGEELARHLPKSLGFCTGLDFREPALMLNAKNTATFKQGMVFCLSVGLQNLELSNEDKARTPDKSPVRSCCCY
jgi:nucleosome binding factor SPN SPT16 subunit